MRESIFHFRRRVKVLFFFAEMYSCRRDIKALFHGINIRELGLINSRETGLSFEKIACIDIDPLTTNIAIQNDSLTLLSVVFTTFLHFARNFRKTLELPSEKTFPTISYFAFVKGLFLDPFFCKTKFSQFESKTRENYFI